MRIAIVAPPWYSVPPDGYGGINQQCYLLARELDRLGHDVTVYCREGSTYPGRTVEMFPSAWDPLARGAIYDLRWLTYLIRVYDDVQTKAFDLVQEHSNRGIFAAVRSELPIPVVAVLHEPMSGEQVDFLETIQERVTLVPVSQAQRVKAPTIAFRPPVHEAVDVDSFAGSNERDSYLLQIARISPEKGQHIAIEVARATGRRLLLAGKVDWNAQGYFEQSVRPHLGGDIEWVENVVGSKKTALLARAHASVFPIQWDEPFGLAMAESMASGTPVIACPRGSAPELVEEGVTGFLASTVDEFVKAIDEVDQVDRGACAASARLRFHPHQMAGRYESLFMDVLHEIGN